MKRRTLLTIAVAVLVLGAAAAVRTLFSPSGDGPAPPPVERTQEKSFATWDEFLTSEEGRAAGRRHVVFIGIDGAAWNIIDPMIADGLLPTFAKLKNEGSFGVLSSVDCYVSPPAWAAMMTGHLPDKTGVHTFGHWDPKRQTFIELSADDIMTPTLWDITSLAGLRTAVTNVPMTYPVREVDGIMVSGLMTPVTLSADQNHVISFTALGDRSPNVQRLFLSRSPSRRQFLGQPVRAVSPGHDGRPDRELRQNPGGDRRGSRRGRPVPSPPER